MGLNFAGFVCNRRLSDGDLAAIVGHAITADGTASFEDAATAFHDLQSVDVLHTESGTLGLVGMDSILSLTPSSDGDMFSFLVSDVSNTYYGQLSRDGSVVGKSVLAMGNVVEQHGDAVFTDDYEERSELVWNYIHKWTGISPERDLEHRELVHFSF